MATHSSILAWKIPRTEESDGLQSIGSPRVGHDWAIECEHGWFCLPTWIIKLSGTDLLHILATHWTSFGGDGGLVAKPCPTLATPWTCSQTGFSVRGTFQARIPEWVAGLPLVHPKYLSIDWLVHKPPVHSWLRRRLKSSRQTSELVKCKFNLNLYVSLKLSTPGALPQWSSG